MPAKPPAPALRVVDRPQAAQAVASAPHDKDSMLRDAQYQLRNNADVPALLAEVQSPAIATEKLALLAMVAWKQHSDSASILTASIKVLRDRLPAEEYRALLAQMPGFAF